MVRLLISGEFFGINESEKSIREQLKHWGAGDISFTENGFISAVMTENAFENFISSIKKDMDTAIENIINKYDKVKYISHNNGYTNFTIIGKDLSKKDKKSIALDIYMSVMAYQVFSGIPQAETGVVTKFCERKGGKVVDYFITP